MIQGTSAMDQPIVEKHSASRRLIPVAIVSVALLLGGFVLYPTIRGWMSAERSVERSRLRLGEMVRGGLERDLSVQGRIVAAFHPTAFSPASGIVTLKVQAGAVVTEGQLLAVLESPELNSRLMQERSTLQSLASDLDRQRILAKQSILADRQQIDLSEVELESARRAMHRAERSRQEGIVNEVEYEEAQDDLRRAELALDHARQNAALREETLQEAQCLLDATVTVARGHQRRLDENVDDRRSVPVAFFQPPTSQGHCGIP